jgi:GntR family L-lactate dehydrogenase operon transcriptional regulator
MQAILNGEQEQARSVISDHLNFVHNKLTQADADTARLQRLGRLSPSVATSS